MTTSISRSRQGTEIVAPSTIATGRLGRRARCAVVLPVYNHADTIGTVFDAVAAFAEKHRDIDMVFADDGSTDATPKRLTALINQQRLPNVKLISFSANRGKGRTIQAAFAALEADSLCFMDGDLAYPPSHIPALLDALRDHDVVIGSRRLADPDKATTAPLRRLLGETFNRLARVMLGLPYRDTQAGLKGFRLDAARQIFARQRLAGFAFDAEVLFLARRLGHSIGEVPAHVTEAHTANPSSVNLIRDPIHMLGALVRIRYSALRGQYD